ncbi:MAG: hypothetical protein K2J90_05025 [Lachnospiraceae bacterium]|nr:hypothetical protein [Lachnospiraceae bacterium]
MIYCIVMVCLLIIVSMIIDLCRAVLFSKLKKQIDEELKSVALLMAVVQFQSKQFAKHSNILETLMTDVD